MLLVDRNIIGKSKSESINSRLFAHGIISRSLASHYEDGIGTQYGQYH